MVSMWQQAYPLGSTGVRRQVNASVYSLEEGLAKNLRYELQLLAFVCILEAAFANNHRYELQLRAFV